MWKKVYFLLVEAHSEIQYLTNIKTERCLLGGTWFQHMAAFLQSSSLVGGQDQEHAWDLTCRITAAATGLPPNGLSDLEELNEELE